MGVNVDDEWVGTVHEGIFVECGGDFLYGAGHVVDTTAVLVGA